MDAEGAAAGMALMRAGYAALAAAGIDSLTHPELLALLGELETLTNQLPTQSHRILARLVAEASPTKFGAKSMREVLSMRLRISRSDARRRLAEAAELGPRTALTGQPLEPLLTATAAAQGVGTVGAEHVAIIRDTLHRLPSSLDPATREQAEATLVRAATTLDPDALRKAAGRLLALIDQDGPSPDDTERARKRGFWIGRQGRDGMTPARANLDPQAMAIFEAIFAKLAAPGMANPDDDTPRTNGTPTQDQIDGDTRSVGQRQHDALTAIGRSVLSSGELGQHNGLPVTIIVSTTLQELESAAGCAVTGGATLLPMSEVIRMAAHAHHYLRIYDKHSHQELYLARTKRLASAAQRIVLHARDRGCTAPGCTVSGYHTQVHHTNGWKRNGQTNIDEMTLACPGDNRKAEDGWITRIRDGRTEWVPPPPLDTGQARINTYHHPDRILADPDTDTDTGDDDKSGTDPPDEVAS